MQDKRQHERFRLEALDVNGNMIFATKVDIIDISAGGLSLKADRRLNIGGGYVIKLKDKEKVISIKGIVAWASLSGIIAGPDGETIPVYTAGMEFKNVTAEKIAELLDFMERKKKEEV